MSIKKFENFPSDVFDKEEKKLSIKHLIETSTKDNYMHLSEVEILKIKVKNLEKIIVKLLDIL